MPASTCIVAATDSTARAKQGGEPFLFVQAAEPRLLFTLARGHAQRFADRKEAAPVLELAQLRAGPKHDWSILPAEA